MRRAATLLSVIGLLFLVAPESFAGRTAKSAKTKRAQPRKSRAGASARRVIKPAQGAKLSRIVAKQQRTTASTEAARSRSFGQAKAAAKELESNKALHAALGAKGAQIVLGKVNVKPSKMEALNPYREIKSVSESLVVDGKGLGVVRTVTFAPMTPRGPSPLLETKTTRRAASVEGKGVLGPAKLKEAQWSGVLDSRSIKGAVRTWIDRAASN